MIIQWSLISTFNSNGTLITLEIQFGILKRCNYFEISKASFSNFCLKIS